MLTIEELEQQLAELRAGLQQLQAQISQQRGAILLAEQLLQRMRAQGAEAVQEDGELE